MTTKTATLKAPGATLYYEVRGTGPLLVMIPGGPADAGAFAGLVEQLADRYTTLAYDPRGNSRSTLDGAPQDQNMDVHGDDAARLIDAMGAGAARILGSSGGAQIGLNLAARHPGKVRTLVAHEPPCILLMPDATERRKSMDTLYDTYQREGTEAAMALFFAQNGMSAPPPLDVLPPPVRAMMTRINANMSFFLGHGLKPISNFVPDVATLRAGAAKIIVGVGAETVGQTAHLTGLALAKKLGVQAVTFPGDHNGFGPHAAAFAATLDRVLQAP